MWKVKKEIVLSAPLGTGKQLYYLSYIKAYKQGEVDKILCGLADCDYTRKTQIVSSKV